MSHESGDSATVVVGESHLMNAMAVAECQQRWAQVQRTFAADPQTAVVEAHALVSEVIDGYRGWCTSIGRRWSEQTRSPEELGAVLDAYHALLRELIDL